MILFHLSRKEIIVLAGAVFLVLDATCSLVRTQEDHGVALVGQRDEARHRDEPHQFLRCWEG